MPTATSPRPSYMVYSYGADNKATMSGSETAGSSGG